MRDAPILVWIRRDLRLGDHAALAAAMRTGQPVIPVFIKDGVIDTLGAAPKWRFGLGVAQFKEALQAIGSDLILRSGDALDVLKALISETGATSVYWMRAYDTQSIERDTGVKAALGEMGVEATSFAGNLLFEPWKVKNKSGGYFKVYTPFWRNVSQQHVNAPLAPIEALAAPESWPTSEELSDWKMGQAMNRGADIVAPFAKVGEPAALRRLHDFLDERIEGYKEKRDFPMAGATSGLSENLTYGEISPSTIWYAGQNALQAGARGAEHFLKELVWREFAYHLMFHFPQLASAAWKPDWASFPWKGDSDRAQRWRQGLTGEAFIDAGMRELYVTGTMHNRVRMIAASYLTKHLMTDWRVGLKWFEETLIDWDPAANAMGWQWVAGSGPDAAPFFRIFNPQTQAEKFDGDRAYRERFLNADKSQDAAAFFQAVPRSWWMAREAESPMPLVDLATGRKAALSALEQFKEKQA